MPNWSSNRLYVTGKPEEVKEFTDTLGTADANGMESDFSFHQTVPMPSNVARGNLPFGEEPVLNWYDWSIENWGTKWDACDVEPDISVMIKAEVVLAIAAKDESLCIDIGFETAWAPPTDWLENVSKKFPKLHFEIAYSEQGMGFCGTVVAINGELTDNPLEGGCTFSEDEDEEYMPTGEYADFIERHSIGCGG